MNRSVFCFFIFFLGSLSFQAVALSHNNAQLKSSQIDKVTPGKLSSPEATVSHFISSMDKVRLGDENKLSDAVSTLNLEKINVLIRKERGKRLAWLLSEVINRIPNIDTKKFPSIIGNEEWILETFEKGSISLERKSDGSWLFSSSTLSSLPEIYESVSHLGALRKIQSGSENLPWDIKLRSNVPSFLKQKIILLENWRWIALLIVIGLGIVVDWFVSLSLRKSMSRWFDKRPHYYASIKDRNNCLRPLGIMAMSVIWWIGLNLIGLPETALMILLVAVKALTSIAAVWAAYRLVDLIAGWLAGYANRTKNKLDDVLLPLIPRTLKVFVTVIGVIFVADNLNIDVTGLLAGLGLGGLAFALAAKDMVQNLFGSITVLLDRTFSVGDWIVVEGQEGTIEKMGFRSTRIRTFYNSIVIIPNSMFITAKVDNMGERRFRRYKANFGLAYDTPPENIEAFCEGLRELVRHHPYMRRDYYHIYLNDLGSDSLSVLVYVFWETPDWATELRERHRFLIDCLRLAKQLGVEYAFPTQTLYVRNDEVPTHPEFSKNNAGEDGKKVAQEIISSGPDRDNKPPPVKFP